MVISRLACAWATPIQGFKLTVAQSPMATRNASWVPKNYILLAQFATMTSLKGSLFFGRFLVDYTNISHILSVSQVHCKISCQNLYQTTFKLFSLCKYSLEDQLSAVKITMFD